MSGMVECFECGVMIEARAAVVVTKRSLCCPGCYQETLRLYREEVADCEWRANGVYIPTPEELRKRIESVRYQKRKDAKKKVKFRPSDLVDAMTIRIPGSDRKGSSRPSS